MHNCATHSSSCPNRNVGSCWKTSNVSRLPKRRGQAARRLRGTFRMPARQRKRMSALLAKGNDGTLTAEESQELNALVDQFERQTLDMACARSALKILVTHR